jgi:hypothetical protein
MAAIRKLDHQVPLAERFPKVHHTHQR